MKGPNEDTYWLSITTIIIAKPRTKNPEPSYHWLLLLGLFYIFVVSVHRFLVLNGIVLFLWTYKCTNNESLFLHYYHHVKRLTLTYTRYCKIYFIFTYIMWSSVSFTILSGGVCCESSYQISEYMLDIYISSILTIFPYFPNSL